VGGGTGDELEFEDAAANAKAEVGELGSAPEARAACSC
jgi:hypothetical protein